MKKTTNFAHSVNSGADNLFEIPLDPNGFSGGNILIDCLGFNRVAVSVRGIGATGTSGTADVLQSNIDSPTGAITLGTIQFLPNSTTQAVFTNVTCRYVMINTKQIVFGIQGSLIINLVGKI